MDSRGTQTREQQYIMLLASGPQEATGQWSTGTPVLRHRVSSGSIVWETRHLDRLGPPGDFSCCILFSDLDRWCPPVEERVQCTVAVQLKDIGLELR